MGHVTLLTHTRKERGNGTRVGRKGLVITSCDTSTPVSPKHHVTLVENKAFSLHAKKKQDFFSNNSTLKPEINSQTGQKTASVISQKKKEK